MTNTTEGYFSNDVEKLFDNYSIEFILDVDEFALRSYTNTGGEQIIYLNYFPDSNFIKGEFDNNAQLLLVCVQDYLRYNTTDVIVEPYIEIFYSDRREQFFNGAFSTIVELINDCEDWRNNIVDFVRELYTIVNGEDKEI